MASHLSREAFKTIEDQLCEHKIVTFKWLSRTLKLHNGLAKQYLLEFLEKQPKEKYIVTYTVFGRKENGELLLILTKVANEDFSRSKNIEVVDKHVYSIQVSDSTFDTAMIYNIDKATYEMQQMSLSSINYHTEINRKDPRSAKAAEKVSDVFSNGLSNTAENNTRRVSPRKKNTDLSKNDFLKKSLPKDKDPGTTTKENEDKLNSSDKSSKDFDKTKPSISKQSRAVKSAAGSGLIANFFSKSNVKKESPNMIEETPLIPVTKIKENVEKTDIGSKSEEKPLEIEVESKMKRTNSKDVKHKRKSKKKGKQMKRIISSFDSDSDEKSDHSDINTDEISELEPEPELVKEPEPEARVKVIDGKKRKRKVIEKLEQDEEGFMHTTKEVIYESCNSDEELEEIPKTTEHVKQEPVEPIPPKKKAKIELLNKKKQSSILSYFQKQRN